MTSYTAINFVPAYLGKVIVQAAHGFYVGEIVRLNGALYQAALADNTTDAASLGIVSLVIDANTFSLTQVGWVTGIANPPSPLTVGSLYYLSSATPGLLQTTPGVVSLPLLYADTTTSGFFMNSYPSVGGGGGQLAYTVVTVDTGMITNHGYICNSAGNINLTLPAAFGVGDNIVATNFGTGSFTILQNAGQNIRFLNNVTTTGAGTLMSTEQGIAVSMIGVIANTSLIVVSGEGSVTGT